MTSFPSILNSVGMPQLELVKIEKGNEREDINNQEAGSKTLTNDYATSQRSQKVT